MAWQDLVAKSIEEQAKQKTRKESLEDELLLLEEAAGPKISNTKLGKKLTEWFGQKAAVNMDKIAHLFARVNQGGINPQTGAFNMKPHEIMYAYNVARVKQNRLKQQLDAEVQAIDSDVKSMGRLKTRLKNPVSQAAFTALFEAARSGHLGAQAVATMIAKIGPGLTDEGLNTLMESMISHPTDLQSLDNPQEALNWIGENLAMTNPMTAQDQQAMDLSILQAQANELAADEEMMAWNEAAQARAMGVSIPVRKTRTAKEIFEVLKAEYMQRTAGAYNQKQPIAGNSTGLMTSQGPTSYTEYAQALKENAEQGSVNMGAVALNQFLSDPKNALALLSGDPVAQNMFRGLYTEDHATDPIDIRNTERVRQKTKEVEAGKIQQLITEAEARKEKLKMEEEERKFQYEMRKQDYITRRMLQQEQMRQEAQTAREIMKETGRNRRAEEKLKAAQPTVPEVSGLYEEEETPVPESQAIQENNGLMDKIGKMWQGVGNAAPSVSNPLNRELLNENAPAVKAFRWLQSKARSNRKK
jgi:hypothetical protein